MMIRRLSQIATAQQTKLLRARSSAGQGVPVVAALRRLRGCDGFRHGVE
jgi:hypothetical protein